MPPPTNRPDPSRQTDSRRADPPERAWLTQAGHKDPSGNLPWQPLAGPAGAGGPPVKLMLYGGGTLAVLAAVVVAIMLLTPSDRPGLVAVAGPAEYADRLDIPYDPFGRVAARRLLFWAADSADPDRAPVRRPDAVREPMQLADLMGETGAAAVNAIRLNPVVIYIALPGGVDETGEPILYSGRPGDGGRPEAVPLVVLLDRLRTAAPDKRKVLVLDAGRGPPDAAVGEVAADFARAVRDSDAVNKAIDADPNLTVVLGQDRGQTGWEAGRAGGTDLATGVMSTLGLADADARVWEWFDRLAEAVTGTSTSGRPAPQTPVLLPADPERWAGDRRDGFDRRPFFRPKQPSPPPSALPGDLGRAAAGDEAAELAARPVPPTAYTPLAWRRYRELFLRYERAIEAGEDGGGRRLRDALAAAKQTIKDGLELDTAPLKTSGGLLRAAGLNAPAETAAGRVEGHLRPALDKFPAGPLPATLANQAVDAREAAEAAAFGVKLAEPTATATNFPFSERVWPAVSDRVRAADAVRREGEDTLFHTDASAAGPKLDRARDGYRKADALGGKLRFALLARDKAFADLPFLGRWAAERPGVDLGTVRTAWAAAHKLDALLETPLDTEAAIDERRAWAVELDEAVSRLAAAVAKEAAELAAVPAYTPGDWLRARQLLTAVPPPLLPPADRRPLWERVSNFDPRPVAQVPAPPPDPAVAADRRLQVLAAAGGESGKGLPPAAAQILALRQVGVANAAARQLALWPGPGDEVSGRRRVAGELVRQEPAVGAAVGRWQVLLAAQARRYALDHWYADNKPFFTTPVAKGLLDLAVGLDARGGRRDQDDRKETADWIALPPLGLAFADGPGEAVWTSERSRTFPLKAAGRQPPGGKPTGWAMLPPGGLRFDKRLPANVRGPATDGVTVTAVDEGAEAPPGVVNLSAHRFFRGQYATAAVPIGVAPEPDLVVTDIPSRDAWLGVRADPNVGPGAVSILLDYSGSMARTWGAGGRVKKEAVLDVLRPLLRDLPAGTRLTVQAYVGNDTFADDKVKTFVDNALLAAGDRQVDKLFGELDREAVSGATPLVEGMRQALEKQDRDLVNADLPRTLIVLTDGIDTTSLPEAFGKAGVPADVIKEPSLVTKHPGPAGELLRLVRGRVAVVRQQWRTVSMHVAVFGADADETALARNMLDQIPKAAPDRPGLGVVYTPTDTTELKKALLAALRPKPLLFTLRGRELALSGVQAGGIPAPPAAANVLPEWVGPLPPGQYLLKYGPDERELLLRPGDGLAVKLKSEAGQTRVTREVHYRDVDAREYFTRAAARGWHAACPASRAVPGTNGVAAVHATVALERTDGLDTAKRLAIELPRPAAVWWELTDDRDRPFVGRAWVSARYERPAPTWHLAALLPGKTLPEAQGQKLKARARAVGPADLPRSMIRLRSLTEPQLKELVQKELLLDAAPGLTVRVAVEDARLGRYAPPDDPSAAAAPAPRLVVRITDDKGRRLVVVPAGRNFPTASEHRYYYHPTAVHPDGRRKVIGITAVFGEVLPTDELDLSVYDTDEFPDAGTVDVPFQQYAEPLIRSPQPR